MSEKTGYIGIHRKIMEHWLFEKNRPKTKFEAWLIMLMEVNHTEQKVLIQGEVITCGRGESLKSLDTWGMLFRWDKSKVRRFLKLLESDSMIVLKSTPKTTHLSICNYDSYQTMRNTYETHLKRKRNTDETQTTLNNNDNNGNKDKKERIYTFPEQILMKISKPEKVWKEYHLQHIPVTLHNETFILNWVDWIDHLISKKKRPTENAAKKQLEKLSKVDNPNLWLTYAIEHNWQGLYEPQFNNTGNNNGQKHEQTFSIKL